MDTTRPKNGLGTHPERGVKQHELLPVKAFAASPEVYGDAQQAEDIAEVFPLEK